MWLLSPDGDNRLFSVCVSIVCIVACYLMIIGIFPDPPYFSGLILWPHQLLKMLVSSSSILKYFVIKLRTLLLQSGCFGCYKQFDARHLSMIKYKLL